MRTKTKLPKPDDWGHYWLGAKPTGGGVIFKAGKPSYGAPGHASGYFASRGVMGGVLFESGEICYFATPELAYQALLDAGYEEGAKKS